ncbi:MAG: hypothetical protein AB1556_02050 [Bacillota bacterium]
MKLPAKAAIIEVLLRDGLQNEARPVPLPVKIDCLHKLPGAGLREIEIGAFVDPRRVPQMAGTRELAAEIQKRTFLTFPSKYAII